MYNESKDDYTCDFCNKSYTWESPPPDGMRGGYQMWYCEECNKDFCRDCFTNKYGESEFHEMLSGEMVLCPDCWNNIK